METLCGADCGACALRESCGGCATTGGRPFGGACVCAECYKTGGEEAFHACCEQLLREFNALGIADMPPVTQLCQLNGAYVNLEYPLANGQRVKLLDDSRVYLGWQLEREGSDRCYGLVADEEYLLVCEYGCGGSDPQIIVYKKRSAVCGGQI